MGHGNVNTPFPENLRDPMHAEPATMRLQDLFLILSQSVDLGLLAITAASELRATMCFFLVLVVVLVVVLVLESGHVECCAKLNCTHVSGWPLEEDTRQRI